MERPDRYKKILVVPIVFMILMMTIIIFSQMAMEIYAYNYVAGKNIEKINISYLEKYVSDKYVSDKKITDEQTKESVTEQQGITEVSSVISFIMPVKGGVTTSVYGDMVSRSSKHLGHDWAVNIGTKVVASADGVVEMAYYSDSYGYNVLVNHGNGIKTRYAHLSELKVTSGQYVKQNQIIGLSGSTGESTGPHLHFEIIKNGKKVNPMGYLN